MRPIWKDILTAFFMGCVVPGILLNYGVMLLDASHGNSEPAAQPTESQTEETVPSVSLPMRLRKADGTVTEMDMDTYLVGVVLAEMPASFEMEALKAQAVVARTYTRKAYTTGGKHGDGAVCGVASCCQAYITEADYLEKGGTQENIDRIQSAVAKTSGYVLTYAGDLIEATYFSCSGGTTEDAAAVWGTDFPYLRSVESPGEEDAVHFTDSVTFTREEFQTALDTVLPEDSANWFRNVSYTKGGGVEAMEIGGKKFTGTELRTLLGLRSTAFTVTAEAGSITVTTRGYGHRVGMSQYGADAMAVTGSTFEEILAYYYQGTELAVAQ